MQGTTISLGLRLLGAAGTAGVTGLAIGSIDNDSSSATTAATFVGGMGLALGTAVSAQRAVSELAQTSRGAANAHIVGGLGMMGTLLGGAYLSAHDQGTI